MDKNRNSPILRSGIVSGMPSERLQDRDTGESYRAWLAEVRSIGGLSGSPVFVVLERGRTPDGGEGAANVSIRREILLLGMVRGHFDMRRRSTVDDFLFDEDSVNMGIATVTPIQDVLDILDYDELKRERRKLDAELQERIDALSEMAAARGLTLRIGDKPTFGDLFGEIERMRQFPRLRD